MGAFSSSVGAGYNPLGDWQEDPYVLSFDSKMLYFRLQQLTEAFQQFSIGWQELILAVVMIIWLIRT